MSLRLFPFSCRYFSLIRHWISCSQWSRSAWLCVYCASARCWRIHLVVVFSSCARFQTAPIIAKAINSCQRIFKVEVDKWYNVSTRQIFPTSSTSLSIHFGHFNLLFLFLAVFGSENPMNRSNVPFAISGTLNLIRFCFVRSIRFVCRRIRY